MIKPHELRIGNYFNPCRYGKGILLPTSTIAVVQTIDIFQVRWVKLGDIPAQVEVWPDSLFNEMNPMPLTEEWLLKFGFKSVGKLHPTYKFKHLIIEASLMRDHYILRQIVNKEDSLALNQNLRYVHQLQNLFFCLTGEELTIKP